MRGVRGHFSLGLVLLMSALTGHCCLSAPPPEAVSGGDARTQTLRRMVAEVKSVEENRAQTAAPLSSTSVVRRDFRDVRSDRADQVIVISPRDLRKKEKFLKHMTGPLYFSPKCRKHVYRLYHHTRECTIPAYFKRCARLLKRLAGSPQCTEG
ncbi:aLK and LTK ligand 2a [Genypterus blacodes]|uniref:aLK and LTK ligand 2a n=1 Tax=Genypterus blacodes TaxID=154954 RepID=UPI003F75CB2D